MKKVLITGADGFIGKNLVDRMLNAGKEVFAIVYPGNKMYSEYKNVMLHISELDLKQIMEHVEVFPNDIDVMYHFAWIGVNPELREKLELQLQNISMTVECLKFAKALGIARLVLPGSTNEYLYYGKPINKFALPSPENAYGAVKIAIRYLCSNYANRNNIEFIYAIITGIYAAERKDNNVIYYTIDKLLNGESPSLTRLEQLWDYVYIDDVINALHLIGEKGKAGAVYAIGHGDNWPLMNYIDIIHQLIDPSIPLGIGEKEYSESKMPASCIDLTDIERDVGFKPKVNFKEGIRRVINKIREERYLNV